MSATASSITKMAMVLLLAATACFAQAPPELQAKLSAEIKQLELSSADPQGQRGEKL